MKDIASNDQWQPQHELLRNTLSKIFGDVEPHLFELIESSIVWKEISGGEVLFNKGEVGNSLYGVLSGRLRAIVPIEGAEAKILGDISQGETVGEMAVFSGEPRSATVVAIRDSVLVEVSKSAFEDIIRASPLLVMNITKLVIDRLKRQNLSNKVTPRIINISVVGLCQPVQTQDFCRNLAQELSKKGEVRVINPQHIQQVLGDESLAHAAKHDTEKYRVLSNWLHEQEAMLDFVLYESTDLSSEWVRRSLRQADYILLLADANQNPRISELEREIFEPFGGINTAAKALVLLHPSTTSFPANTAEWLSGRNLHRHFHLRSNSQGDYKRIRRFITGTSIGFVLAGGGAKAFAHVGVYRALSEAGIPIDMVGGTSMGAIIAGLLAHDFPPEEVYRILRKIYIEGKNPTNDYNLLPVVSILKGRRVRSIIDENYGGKNIEDNWKPFFCVSSNLTLTKSVVHQYGDMAHAVRASISLPGVFPPVLDKEGLLVDGGLINNLPVDEMIRLGAGRIISSDLNIQKQMNDEMLLEINPIRLLLNRLVGRKRSSSTPGFMSIILQSTTLNSDFKTVQFKAMADLYFNPNVVKFGMMDWTSYDKIVEVGYQHACEVLADQKHLSLLD